MGWKLQDLVSGVLQTSPFTVCALDSHLGQKPPLLVPVEPISKCLPPAGTQKPWARVPFPTQTQRTPSITWLFSSSLVGGEKEDAFGGFKKHSGGGASLMALPANMGDMGSIIRLGRFPYAAEQLSPCTTTTVAKCCSYWSPRALEPMLCNKRSHCSEKPMLQLHSSPCSLQLEKSSCSNEGSVQPKINKFKKKIQVLNQDFGTPALWVKI